MKELIGKAAVLIEALPYIQKFRNSIMVVKFGGSAMEDPELVRSTMRDAKRSASVPSSFTAAARRSPPNSGARISPSAS